ncbi:MAG: hypothetical protein CMP57_04000 [Flavobacteriales bacterium]|nr:hypothetical protein [Flavobacteriales bacterium]|tara:strand:+ start:131 stop:310 length:180 start_codon:yes stop_codon:yes gene_type:complete
MSKRDNILEREQVLLRKLYDCHEEMEDLLDLGKEDFHYILIEMLIDRLEKHLASRNGIV